MISQPFSQTFQAYNFLQYYNNNSQEAMKNIPKTQNSFENTHEIHSLVQLEEINSLIKILSNKIAEIETKNKELAMIESQLKLNEPELPKQADPDEMKELEDMMKPQSTSIIGSIMNYFKPK
ncbi:hypothetical protein TVAG_290930 [Trichomonas vaginalis G3]|uniref:Uncharacterized protein n=1 Tax=Trichomonas vaginalis (strain ATCC PRA-98 / G3) TaxID=412133 RepID=A2F3X1_TRIV3|nr:hypothetical protein TVAGG3_0307510 [Trichomonas vaginalis G3]EAY00387.1 hypothetical protein TVAG_290930 [Trichomonas vaginalis G3]KAI5528356.1 hypothetical protein TVAGG3_0307510 [Trichomonas vaginalis G3]|eukprot:XP_001313316.1 hypothetical protein [Trichomonas vaginalis G3]